MTSRLITLRIVVCVALAVIAGAIGWLMLRTEALPVATPSRATASAPNAATPATPLAAPPPAAREQAARPTELVPGRAGVRGRLVDESRTPLADVDVRLALTTRRPAFAQDEWIEQHVATRSASDGTFEFADVDPAASANVVVDPRGKHCIAPVPPVRLAVDAWCELGDIVAMAGVSCSGRVVDGAGKPVEGAVVRLWVGPVELMAEIDIRMPQPDALMATFSHSEWTVAPTPQMLAAIARRADLNPAAVTDADGRFALYSVAEIPITGVIVVANGFTNKNVGDVPSRPPNAPVDLGEIVLERGATLAGRVVDARGTPVANASVFAGPVSATGAASFLSREVRTDGAGLFAIAGVVERPHLVAVRREGERSWTVVQNVDPRRDPFDVVVRNDATARITIVDERHEPVANARAAVVIGSTRWTIARHLGVDASCEVDERDANGAFLASGLAPGDYTALVRAPGFQLAEDGFTVANADVAVLIVLKRSVPLVVRVRDGRDGRPIEGATVRLSPQFSAANSFTAARATTDAEGVAALDRVVESKHELLVEHDGYADSAYAVEEDVTSIDVELVAGGSLVVRLLDGGVPVGTHRAVVLSPNVAVGDLLVRSGTTDATGGAHVENLAPGVWSLAVLKERVEVDADPNDRLWWRRDSDHVEARAEVTIVSGQETALDVDVRAGATGSTGHVFGRLTINGQPARAMLVLSSLEHDDLGNQRALSGDDGRFDFGLIPAGRIQVGVDLASHARSITPTTVLAADAIVPSAGALELPIDLALGSLRGRITDEAGARVAGALVRAEIRANDEARTSWEFDELEADVDVDAGTYVFERICAGPNLITIEAPGFLTQKGVTVEVPRGGGAALDLVARRATILTGSIVLDESLAFEHWATLRIAPLGVAGIAEREADLEGDQQFAFDEVFAGQWRAFVDLHGIVEDPAKPGELEDVVIETWTIDVTIPREGLKGLVLRPKFAFVPSTPSDEDEDEEH